MIIVTVKEHVSRIPSVLCEGQRPEDRKTLCRGSGQEPLASTSVCLYGQRPEDRAESVFLKGVPLVATLAA